jgi:Holliday junction resolvasome RuvABC ATP-dependent DNA helicase subunit
MGRRFLEVNCATLGTTKDFIEYVLLDKVMGMKPVTVLFDEAHKLSSEITTLMLSLVSPSNKGINVLEYRGWEICYDMTKINTIFATTDSFRMSAPLIDRCEKIYFKSYSNTELITMLKFYLPNVEFFVGFSQDSFEDLAYACRGRGRDTFALAQKIIRQCKGSNRFTIDMWREIKDVFGINPMGLNAQELTLMRIVRSVGVASCSTIATRMMIGEENVSEEIEIRPKELALIANTPRGRKLTDRGEEYFTILLKETKTESQDKLTA